MKFTTALAALLAATASAISVPTEKRNTALPEIDLTNIPDRFYAVAATPESQIHEARGLTERQSCPAGYPFLCNGFCCQYNICCSKQCCLPSTQFCGADGLCYVWN